MKTKGTTVYLSEANSEYIKTNYKSINGGVNDAIDALIAIRKKALSELRNYFTPGEWSFLADSLNGSLTYNLFRVNAGALAQHCMDSEQYDGTATKWDVDMTAFLSKLNILSGAQVEAVYFRVEQFWNNPKSNLEAFSKY